MPLGQGRFSKRRSSACFALFAALLVSVPVSAESPSRRPAAKLPAPLIAESGDRKLPDYTFQELQPDGSLDELGFLDLRGKPIVAVSWATWCGVCRRDLPRLDGLQALLEKEGVLVAALSIDDMKPSGVAREMTRRGLRNLRVFHDTQKMFFVSTSGIGVPSAVIADREGRIVARAQGSVRWDDPQIIEFIRTLAPPEPSLPVASVTPLGDASP